VPAAVRVAVLLNPAEVTIAAANLRDVETAARAMALEIKVFNARTSGEIDATFAAIARERPDAIFISSGPLFTSRRVQLAHFATHHRIPAIHGSRFYPEVGGLISTEQVCRMRTVRPVSTSAASLRARSPRTCRSCR